MKNQRDQIGQAVQAVLQVPDLPGIEAGADVGLDCYPVHPQQKPDQCVRAGVFRAKAQEGKEVARLARHAESACVSGRGSSVDAPGTMSDPSSDGQKPPGLERPCLHGV